MASSTIAPRYIFGFRPDVADNVAYSDDGAVVFPAGHNVVLYSADAKAQRLIPGTLESEGITAMCVSGNKKLLAVAERSDKAIITVYDLQTLKRRKALTSTDAGSKASECTSKNAFAGVCLLLKPVWQWAGHDIVTEITSDAAFGGGGKALTCRLATP
jgi:hypothetical protein